MAKIMMFVELRDVYDGYSVAVYEDGTMENRWDAMVERFPDGPVWKDRQRKTQEWIDAQKEERRIEERYRSAAADYADEAVSHERRTNG